MRVQEPPIGERSPVADKPPAGPVEDLGRGTGHGRFLTAARAIGKRFNPLLDFALPPRCPGCGSVVAGDGRFCLACWTALDWLSGDGCATCALPIADLGEGACCAACLADPPAFDAVRAAVLYSPIAARVALKLKYGRKPGIASIMARALVRHVADADAPLLIPVPLHRRRLWSRGFNQSALIGRAIRRMTGAELIVDALVREKATPPLRGLGARARRKATAGAFRVAPEARARIAGRHVMLVDDVCTSGATANGCSAVLKRAGALGVTVLCWARVPPGGAGFKEL